MLEYSLNTLYILISGALVMWMAAGFSMLEAGLVRASNTIEIITKNVSLYSLACVMYFIIGYEIMYPGSGGFMLLELSQSADGDYAPAADFFFQAVFVATAMSVVSGAVAERMKLWSFLLFSVIMTGFLYPVEGSWVWGGQSTFGLFNLSELGFSDFAGSGAVHLSGAVAALTGSIILGPRVGKYDAEKKVRPIPGANLPLAALGTMILWFGWFGFNGGSQLSITGSENALAVAIVFLNTNMAAATGMLIALLITKIRFGKIDMTMGLNGALAGLVAITAGPGSPAPWLAALIGLAAGCLVVFSVPFFDKLCIDDPVGAISVHGAAGILGLLVVPLSNSDASFMVQLLGTVAIIVWIGVTSLIVWYIISKFVGLRVSLEEETQGCDIELCGMEAYPEFVDK